MHNSAIETLLKYAPIGKDEERTEDKRGIASVMPRYAKEKGGEKFRIKANHG